MQLSTSEITYHISQDNVFDVIDAISEREAAGKSIQYTLHVAADVVYPFTCTINSPVKLVTRHLADLPASIVLTNITELHVESGELHSDDRLNHVKHLRLSYNYIKPDYNYSLNFEGGFGPNKCAFVYPNIRMLTVELSEMWYLTIVDLTKITVTYPNARLAINTAGTYVEILTKGAVKHTNIEFYGAGSVVYIDSSNVAMAVHSPNVTVCLQYPYSRVCSAYGCDVVKLDKIAHFVVMAQRYVIGARHFASECARRKYPHLDKYASNMGIMLQKYVINELKSYGYTDFWVGKYWLQMNRHESGQLAQCVGEACPMCNPHAVLKNVDKQTPEQAAMSGNRAVACHDECNNRIVCMVIPAPLRNWQHAFDAAFGPADGKQSAAGSVFDM